MSLPTTTTVSRPQAAGYGAALGELLVRLAPSPQIPIVVQTAQLQPARFTTESSPEEVLQAFGDVYSLSSAVGGEGLIDRYRRGGAARDSIRYWDSRGIDVSPTAEGLPDEIRLLHDVDRIDTIAGEGRMANLGSVVWVTNGNEFRKTTNVLATTVTWTNDDPHDGETPTTVEDVAVVGNEVYAALGANEIHRWDGSSWSQWSDVEAVRVWSVKDRVLASDGQDLYEAAAGTGSVLLYTLPPGVTWTDAADAGEVIIASATNGFVYSFGIDQNGDLEVRGQTLLKDETPRALTARSNIVWILATQGQELRLWQGQMVGGTIQNLQLLREWFGCGCGVLTATRDQVIAGVSEPDGSYLWRLQLETAGLSRAQKIANSRILGLLVVDGITVVSARQDGVFRDSERLVSEGWIMSPLADFFRAEEKSWVTAWADVLAQEGQRVELFYATNRDALFNVDSPLWFPVRSYSNNSEGDEVGIGDVVARSLALLARLTPGPDNTSPRVRSLSARSYPGKGDIIIQLPVDVSDQIERNGKRLLRINGWGQQVYSALRQREGGATLCRLFRTGDQVRGLIESVATPIPVVTKRGTVTQVSIVTIRGRRVPEITRFASFDGWGGYAWGSAPWGGGQVNA
jgi:hypothetical protein